MSTQPPRAPKTTISRTQPPSRLDSNACTYIYQNRQLLRLKRNNGSTWKKKKHPFLRAFRPSALRLVQIATAPKRSHELRVLQRFQNSHFAPRRKWIKNSQPLRRTANLFAPQKGTDIKTRTSFIRLENNIYTWKRKEKKNTLRNRKK